MKHLTITISKQRAAIECAAAGLKFSDFARVALTCSRYPLVYVLAWIDVEKNHAH